MKKTVVSLVLCALLLVLAPVAQAEEEEPGTVTRISYWTIKAGMEDEFEEGLKRHNDFHKAHNDDWALHTWQVVTGKNAGKYLRGTFGHHWADFDAEDEMAEADAADAATNMNLYLESGHPIILNHLPNLSHPPESDGPSAMYRAVFFHLKQNGQRAFMEAVGKAHAAIGKTNWPSNYIWYEVVDGGRIPTLILVLPRANWAAFAPQEKSFAEMLLEAYGEEEAGAILAAFGDSTALQWSETGAYRPDLSYVPADM